MIFHYATAAFSRFSLFKWGPPIRIRSVKPEVPTERALAGGHCVPFNEKRDTTELYRIPYYEDTAGMAPCGAIISNAEDMSHWLIALMNDGKFGDKQVLPPDVLQATLEPAIAMPNTLAETQGFWEVLNPAYGMGRRVGSYRAHLLAYHGGALDGFHSQVSFMPREHIGVTSALPARSDVIRAAPLLRGLRRRAGDCRFSARTKPLPIRNRNPLPPSPSWLPSSVNFPGIRQGRFSGGPSGVCSESLLPDDRYNVHYRVFSS